MGSCTLPQVGINSDQKNTSQSSYYIYSNNNNNNGDSNGNEAAKLHELGSRRC